MNSIALCITQISWVFFLFDFIFNLIRTSGGVQIHSDHVTVTAPTRMWVKAFDLLLNRMKAAQFPFQKVVALSGAGQVCPLTVINGNVKKV